MISLSTYFVTVFFHLLIRLLQNHVRRLPKMSHVCWCGCLQDVFAQRCRAVREACGKGPPWHGTTAYLLESTLVEQIGASGSAPAVG